MWAARMTVDTCIHSPTDTVLFAPGRMAAFTPANVPICCGMLFAQSTPSVVFWQFVNQTYNAVNNYVNRASAVVETGPLLQSYTVAVVVACSVALGAKKLVNAVPALQRLGLVVPYFAVCCAGSCNIAFMRSSEWMGEGVAIFALDGTPLGQSVKAGQQAVLDTIKSRGLFLPIFPLLIPPLSFLLLPSNIVLEICVVTVSIGVGLPIALALLPTTMEFDVATLEPEFHDKCDRSGGKVSKAVANKGL
mmetsp:Transcript_101096/g.231903  ORF Transcript_101096/g.231903 Transcript_101096/m.231903 type:complete len:248 (+) Transcript_101096:406-1149(+)